MVPLAATILVSPLLDKTVEGRETLLQIAATIVVPLLLDGVLVATMVGVL
jgi:hypothetical protein